MNLNVAIEGFTPGCNIKSITVPPHLRRRVSTGISWLDDAMGGKGFTPSTAGLFTGGAGAGKTTLMLQLADSITHTGNVCVFNTNEESLYQVAMTCDRLNIQDGFLPNQEVNIPKCLEFCDQVFAEKVRGQKLRRSGEPKTMFLIVDSLQCMDDGKYADGGTTSATPIRVCKLLTEWAKERQDVVVLFIGQVTKAGDFAGKNVIKHMIDMHLHLYIDADKRSETWGERIFTVAKNRFGVSNRTYVLGMDGTGLWKKGQFHPEEEVEVTSSKSRKK